MIKQQQTRSSWKIITYRIAKWSLAISVWIWTGIILSFLMQYLPNLLTIKKADIGDTWTGKIIDWLSPSKTPPSDSIPLFLDVLKPIVLIIAVLLFIIPPLAFVLKQTLQSVQREGFDKLIEILQEDPYIEILEQILVVLQKIPTSSDLQKLHIISQQQHQALQKEFSHTMQSVQQEFSHTMQSLQDRVFEQTGWLGDLYQQNRDTQETISLDLQKIASLLEQMRDGS